MNVEQILLEPPVMLDLDLLETKPGPYCMSFGFDLTTLTESIRRFGLLAPLFVTTGAGARLDVVSGYRRLLAAKALGRSQVPVHDLSQVGVCSLDCLLMNFFDNLTTRGLNDIEIGMALGRLSTLIQRDEVLAHYMPLLGLPRNEALLEAYLTTEDLSHDIKTSLAGREVSFSTIRALQEMDCTSRAAAFDWISNLRLNMNQQKDFIGTITDLSLKEESPIHSLLGGGELQAVRHAEDLNLPQKAKKVLEVLHARRLPRVHQAERDFQRTIRELHLPPGVRAIHPPYFEGRTYRLEILFETGHTLREKINLLSRLEGLECLGDPWRKDRGAHADHIKTSD